MNLYTARLLQIDIGLKVLWYPKYTNQYLRYTVWTNAEKSMQFLNQDMLINNMKEGANVHEYYYDEFTKLTF